MKTIPLENRTFDTIVIGSGMGSLATASILAQVAKQRVLVLERHFKLGGFLHSFQRKGYQWDPGLHYIGKMQNGSMTREAMDLVTGSGVKWHQISPDFENYVFPNETFSQPSTEAEFIERLIRRFPEEEPAIRRYFKDVKSATGWLQRWFFSKQFGWPLAGMISAGRRLPLTTTRKYLDSHFKDPFLQAILAAQWPDFGTPPDQSAFGVHATVVNDFLNGGYYPIGGSQRIADCAINQIENAGGQCLASHPVEKILIRNNRAIGVRVLRKGKPVEFFAKRIVSGCGVHTTFRNLVPDECAKTEREKLSKVTNGTSAIIAFLGLSQDPRALGFTDTNYWMYDRLDHRFTKPTKDNPYPIDGGFLAFGSLRNPENTKHTAQLITFSRDHEWASFRESKWKKRGSEYEAMKNRRLSELVDYVAGKFPRLRELIDYAELSTPLSVRDFTGHHQGAIYGPECTPERLSAQAWSISTSVKHLYLTGTDLGVPGVNSALMLGVMTAGKLLGWTGMPRVIRAMSKTSRS